MITKTAAGYLEKGAGLKDLASIFKKSPRSNNYLTKAIAAKAKGDTVGAKALYAQHRAGSAGAGAQVTKTPHNWGINKNVPTGAKAGGFDRAVNAFGNQSASMNRAFA